MFYYSGVAAPPGKVINKFVLTAGWVWFSVSASCMLFLSLLHHGSLSSLQNNSSSDPLIVYPFVTKTSTHTTHTHTNTHTHTHTTHRAAENTQTGRRRQNPFWPMNQNHQWKYTSDTWAGKTDVCLQNELFYLLSLPNLSFQNKQTSGFKNEKEIKDSPSLTHTHTHARAHTHTTHTHAHTHTHLVSSKNFLHNVPLSRTY